MKPIFLLRKSYKPSRAFAADKTKQEIFLVYQLVIQRIFNHRDQDHRLQNDEHGANQGRRRFTQQEMTTALCRLLDRFGNAGFPLANNVERLGNGAEIDGFGVALYGVRNNTYFAQGSSYLGVILEHWGILVYEQANVITWKFADAYVNADSVIARISECCGH